MQIKGKLPLAFVAFLGWLAIISSCANQGMPTGGPKDSIPPVIINTHPKLRALNYKDKDVNLTFNEYISSDDISSELVVSPPLEKRPSIRTKSKTLIIQFNEDLRDSTTYSLDFKNSIVDNNEGNPLKNVRFSFSTGPNYDSLRVAGRVMNAFNMEPTKDILVLLQRNLHDSAVFKVRPDYIAKTDEQGRFSINNIASGKYNLFAINDLNNDLKYNEGAEEFAFIDSVIVPYAKFHERKDTLVQGKDTLLIMGETHFFPDSLYLRYFTEDIFSQYLETSKRIAQNKCIFVFDESVKDTFNVRLIGNDAQNWNSFEYNDKVDSIVMWITDTTLMKQDSLEMELSYFLLDSIAQPYVHKDTLLMTFSEPKIKEKKRERKRRKKEKEEKTGVAQFAWKATIPSTMELNSNIKLTAPEPIASFDQSMIRLYMTGDTLKTPLKIAIQEDTSAYRSYIIPYKWEPETKYTFEIDSAAAFNIYGISSQALTQNFTSREEDYYGTILFDFSNVKSPMIVQLLKNSDKEEVVQQKCFSKDGTVEFTMLLPDKYRMKIIYDTNGNGKWDTGIFQDKIQPERVGYSNEVLKLRSNWTEKRKWDVTPVESLKKNIIDKDAEKKKKEKNSKEKKNSSIRF